MAISIQLSYLLGSISFILGLRYLGNAKTARFGNMVAGAGMLMAVLGAIMQSVYEGALGVHLWIIVTGMLAGGIGGIQMSKKVAMTAMPQLISIFNAMGGLCAMLLGLMEANMLNSPPEGLHSYAQLSGIAIGAITFSGSILAFMKLDGKIKDHANLVLVYTSRLMLFLIAGFIAFHQILFTDYPSTVLVLAVVSLVYGSLFVMPIGGADMPVVISLLNSLSGIATALVGLLLSSNVMIIGGTLVGSAGVLLTLVMCKAMNRSLFNVLAGVIRGSTIAVEERTQNIRTATASQLATQLAFSQRVAIIPGYGMAVSQAQHVIHDLQDVLEKRGTELVYIIHPVAGRMPGHMNVLLAEADISYDRLISMEEASGSMNRFDVTIVIGANDVVNPAAEDDPGSPLYGMPIIKAHESKQVFVIKRGMSNGYAGVTNTLFEKENCKLIFGDGKSVIHATLTEVKNI